jgi:catalase
MRQSKNVVLLSDSVGSERALDPQRLLRQRGAALRRRQEPPGPARIDLRQCSVQAMLPGVAARPRARASKVHGMWARPIRITAVTGLLLAAAASAPLAQENDLPTQLVDAFNRLFGSHSGARANHAKGIVAKGTFVPTSEAASLSKAALFAGPSVSVTVRFSNGTGLPDIPDGAKAANPHGLAIKFHLRDGSETDLVLNSLKFFPVATAQEFRDLLLATAESPPGAPEPTKLKRFLTTHPNVPLASATVATPASFAEEEYRGVNAFVLVSKTGARQAVRFVATPEKIVHVKADERPPNFLIDELQARLAKSPVTFHLQAQLAKPGDSTKDPSRPWPDSNRVVDLGALMIDAIVPDSAAAEKDLLFLPGQVPDGIEPSDDPMITARDAAYAVSFARRAQ